LKTKYRLIATALAACLAVGSATAVSAAADANSYPDRPIRFVVPFPPGGAADVVARLLAQRMSESLGKQVVIDNRGGASTIIGSEIVARAVPDGYTILMGTTALAINPSLYAKLPYDTVRDFAPVTQVGSTPLVLVVGTALPVSNVKDVIALAKAKPGQLNFASSGNAGPSHLAGELFKVSTATDMVHVPYKGSGIALPALLGGQVQLMFATLPSAMPLVKSGQLKAVAVTSAARTRALPDLPAIAETVRNFEAVAWYGIVAPAKTPRNIIDTLHRHVGAILARADFRERLAVDGTEPKSGTPQEFAAYIRSETDKWALVVKRSGAKAD
jgi:tripartite-type tricarboxylate transporter receptor subunit TctC